MEGNKVNKGNLLTYRPDIKVVDATVRDGGLVNNFFFSDEFIKSLYEANCKAGVEYMEFGYKADKDIFDEKEFGKWKFCKDQDILDIIGEKGDTKISVMADVGRCNYKRDIVNKADSPIDLVRVATYINTIPAAIEMIEDAHNKGYETTCNIMAISNAKESEIDIALDLLGKSCVDGIYIVDSYGSMFPEEIRKLSETYLEAAEKYGKYIGIHCHNNIQLAFANTIEACAAGVSYLDGTMCGMGRGAGNCYLELLLNFLKNPKYNIYPVYKFIEEHMVPLLENPDVLWGYDLPYAITGYLNQHPRTAIAATSEKRKDYVNFYNELIEKD